jgi:hypothetical protein
MMMNGRNGAGFRLADFGSVGGIADFRGSRVRAKADLLTMAGQKSEAGIVDFQTCSVGCNFTFAH